MPQNDYFVHESSYVDEPCSIGAGTKIWHFSHVMTNCRIGERCNIGQNVVISPDVVIGNNVKLQNNVSVYTGCILEDDVFCGPSMVFTNVINPRSHVIRRDEYKTTLVRRGASIGANSTIVCGITIGRFAFIGARSVGTRGGGGFSGAKSTIVCGITIGRFAFIGAGSVVTRDVADYALVYGNPAPMKAN